MPNIDLLLNLLKEFAWLGNWLFFVLAFVESAPFVGIFIPGATLISVGGILASQGYLNTWDIVFFATGGAIIGDFFSYSLGRWGGNLIKNKETSKQTIFRQGEKFFKRYGNKSIFLGRFFGPVRAIIPFIAGISKMDRKPFIFWNILSAIGWAILNVFLGYFSGTIIVTILKRWSSGLTLVLILILIISTAYWIIKKKDQSLKLSFKTNSLNFKRYLDRQNWFQKLNTNSVLVTEFFNEYKNANEKLFGGLLVVLFLIITYILILILDVF